MTRRSSDDGAGTRDDKVTPLPSARGGPAASAGAPLPPGKVEMIITYLQMREPPPPRRARARAERTAILRAHRPTISFYRYLYETVGGPWLWWERNELDDESLAKIIRDPRVAINVLYVDGVPAGFAELDHRVAGEVELAYFGLIPDFIGRGLGQYLLDWAVERAFASRPERLWVHTCNFDHPGAVVVYQKAGFVPYDQERKLIDDPRLVAVD